MPSYQLTLVNQSGELFDDFAVFQADPLLGAPPGVTAQYSSVQDPNTVIQVSDESHAGGYSVSVTQLNGGAVTDFFQVVVEELPHGTTDQVTVQTPSFTESYYLTTDQRGRVESLSGSITLAGGDTTTVSGTPSGHGLLDLVFSNGDGHVIGEEEVRAPMLRPHHSDSATAAQIADFSHDLAGFLLNNSNHHVDLT